MFSESGTPHSSTLNSSSLIPFGLVSEVLSENCSLTYLCSAGQPTEVLALEEPSADGYSTNALAPHVPCCRHSTEVLALFCGQIYISIVTVSFPLSDVCSIIV